jgi:UDP-2,3-diacylglucosamine pyrophosphatase LpxH
VTQYLAVISDLHISCGALDDFDAELEGHYVAFLRWLGERGGPTELVINGDFLDFVQAAPAEGRFLEDVSSSGVPLCFTEEQSLEKLSAILEAHPSVFAAIRDFLAASKENGVTVLPGNHDPDFFWPKVRAALAEVVEPGDGVCRLFFCLERGYQPPRFPWLWIEHGHQLDPINAFVVDGSHHWGQANPPILKSRDGISRLLECTGTRFLIRYLNSIDARYPFVDNVKPFSRFLRIFGVSALASGRGPLDAVIAIAAMISYLSKTVVGYPRDLLSSDIGHGLNGPHPVAVWYRHATNRERVRLVERLTSLGFPMEMPMEMAMERRREAQQVFEFLDRNFSAFAGIGEHPVEFLGSTDKTLALRVGFSVNETELLLAGAYDLARTGRATTVVMGHTHEPVSRKGPVEYYNTGSWTRYYRYDANERTAAWHLLRKKSYENFPYSLRFAFATDSKPSVEVRTWRERLKD